MLAKTGKILSFMGHWVGEAKSCSSAGTKSAIDAMLFWPPPKRLNARCEKIEPFAKDLVASQNKAQEYL